MRPFQLFGVIVAICFALSGCGGGGAGSDSGVPAAGIHTFGSKGMSVSYIGRQLTPLVATTGQYTSVVAMSGATFTNLTLVPEPYLNQTQIAFDKNSQVWSGGSDNSGWIDRTHIPSTVLGTTAPTFSHDGRIAFSKYDASAGKHQIFAIPRAFNDHWLKKLSDGTGDDTAPAWAPNNLKVAFVRTVTGGKPQIYTMNPDGTGAVRLAAGPNTDLAPCWSADSANILFMRLNTVTGKRQPFIMTASGASPHAFSTILSAFDVTSAAWAPDNTEICFAANKGGNSQLLGTDVKGLGSIVLTTGTQYSDASPCFAPDSRTILFSRTGSPTFLAEIDADGGSGRFFYQSDKDLLSPAWSPFFEKRTFIGTGGVMATTASGFIFGQDSANFASLTQFTAKTPSSAVVTPQTNSGTGQNTNVFLVKADSITALSYANWYYDTPRVVIPGPSGPTASLLLSLDLNGFVSYVIPVGKVSSTRKESKMGGQLVYEGQIRAIFDSNGKNLAPSGAGQVVLDAKSGRLVGYR